MELQEQIYLVAGVLGGVTLFLFVFVIIIALQLKKEKAGRLKNEERFLTMADPSIRRGEELERRGYVPYQGPEHHGNHKHDKHQPVKRQESKLSQLTGGLKKNKKVQRSESEHLPSINSSIYHGYQGRVTDPIPSIYPQQSPYNPHHQHSSHSSRPHHY